MQDLVGKGKRNVCVCFVFFPCFSHTSFYTKGLLMGQLRSRTGGLFQNLWISEMLGDIVTPPPFLITCNGILIYTCG